MVKKTIGVNESNHNKPYTNDLRSSYLVPFDFISWSIVFYSICWHAVPFSIKTPNLAEFCEFWQRIKSPGFMFMYLIS